MGIWDTGASLRGKFQAQARKSSMRQHAMLFFLPTAIVLAANHPWLQLKFLEIVEPVWFPPQADPRILKDVYDNAPRRSGTELIQEQQAHSNARVGAPQARGDQQHTSYHGRDFGGSGGAMSARARKEAYNQSLLGLRPDGTPDPSDYKSRYGRSEESYTKEILRQGGQVGKEHELAEGRNYEQGYYNSVGVQ